MPVTGCNTPKRAISKLSWQGFSPRKTKSATKTMTFLLLFYILFLYCLSRIIVVFVAGCISSPVDVCHDNLKNLKMRIKEVKNGR